MRLGTTTCAVIMYWIASSALAAPPKTDLAAVAAQTTVPTAQGGASRAVVLKLADRTVIVGAAGLGGLEIYDLAGRRIGAVPAGDAAGVDVRHTDGRTGAASAILAVADAGADALRFFIANGASLAETSEQPLQLGFAVEGTCLYRSRADGSLYAFAVGDAGEIDQYLLFETKAGRVAARKVRRLHVPTTVEQCVADDRTGHLYVAEEQVGLWRFNAEPESEIAPALVDAVGLGHLQGEIGGVAVYGGGQGARWLVASDASTGKLLVFDRDKDDSFAGEIAVRLGNELLDQPGGLSPTSGNAPAYPNGLLTIAAEDAPGGARYAFVGMDKLAAALGRAAGVGHADSPGASSFPMVRPIVETVAVGHAGDAADDPAIWRNPASPAQSLIVGTDKQGGLYLYDMAGKPIQFVPDGKMNNVDLREGFRLNGRPIVLLTASDRTRKAVAIYELDTAARRLINIADGVQATGLSDPYGLCMYRSRSGRHYVFVSDPDGLVRQWELVATKSGKVRLKAARDFNFGSQTEGCVADDEAGLLYVAQEDVALWKVAAEPGAKAAPVAIDRIAADPTLKADLEGLGLYDLGNGRGYLIVSSQGNNSYAVYRRDGDRAYLGSFVVVADGAAGIDGISETDGLEVSSANLGPGLEHGAMIAQDGRNVLPAENQNFKIVPWDSIAKALKLEVRR